MTAAVSPLGTRIAAARIADVARHHDGVTDEQRQAATALLADLYEAGERHGVDPDDWAAVTAMPSAALDVVRATDRRRSR